MIRSPFHRWIVLVLPLISVIFPLTNVAKAFQSLPLVRSCFRRQKHPPSPIVLSLGNYATFSLMAAEHSDFLENLTPHQERTDGGAEDDDDGAADQDLILSLSASDATMSATKNSELLAYLPTHESFPSQTRQFLMRLTESYTYERENDENVLLRGVQVAMDKDYSVIRQDLPWTVGNVTSQDVSLDDDSVDWQIFSETLSFAAISRLPKELCVYLLNKCSPASSSTLSASSSALQLLSEILRTLQTEGWQAVSFPQGLALEYKLQPNRGWWKRLRGQSRRPELAVTAIAQAHAVAAPAKATRRKAEVLAQLLEDPQLMIRSEEQSARPPLLTFAPRRPNRLNWKGLQRFGRKQYTRLKRKGRAGVLSYAVFNFVFYTAGMLWQWRNWAPLDPLVVKSSAATVVARKFSRVFASLYVAAQVVKLPKVLGAIALAPVMQKVLNVVRRQIRLSENRSLLLLLSVLFLMWAGLVGIPVVTEYVRLRELVFLDNQMVQLYGVAV